MLYTMDSIAKISTSCFDDRIQGVIFLFHHLSNDYLSRDEYEGLYLDGDIIISEDDPVGSFEGYIIEI